MLITVSGVDCSGKSTQLDLLEEALVRVGVDVRRRWFRPGYSAELDALRKLIRSVRPNAIPAPGRSETRARTFARPSVQVAWATAAIFDTLLQYGAKLRRDLARGHTMLFNRYVLDAALDLQLAAPSLGVDATSHRRWLEAVCPTPDVAFLLTLAPEEALRRMSAKDEPFPDPPDVRALRHACYDSWAKSGSLTVIDASGPAQRVHDDVWRQVSTHLALRRADVESARARL